MTRCAKVTRQLFHVSIQLSDITHISYDTIYTVIRNDCLGSNNLSYIIHLI